jgi:hypothetical protein
MLTFAACLWGYLDMQHEKRNPAALAGADRAGMNILAFASSDNSINTISAFSPQAFIARKYHLQPVVARLICDLAGIGGRAR